LFYLPIKGNRAETPDLPLPSSSSHMLDFSALVFSFIALPLIWFFGEVSLEGPDSPFQDPSLYLFGHESISTDCLSLWLFARISLPFLLSSYTTQRVFSSNRFSFFLPNGWGSFETNSSGLSLVQDPPSLFFFFLFSVSHALRGTIFQRLFAVPRRPGLFYHQISVFLLDWPVSSQLFLLPSELNIFLRVFSRFSLSVRVREVDLSFPGSYFFRSPPCVSCVIAVGERLMERSSCYFPPLLSPVQRGNCARTSSPFGQDSLFSKGFFALSAPPHKDFHRPDASPPFSSGDFSEYRPAVSPKFSAVFTSYGTDPSLEG